MGFQGKSQSQYDSIDFDWVFLLNITAVMMTAMYYYLYVVHLLFYLAVCIHACTHLVLWYGLVLALFPLQFSIRTKFCVYANSTVALTLLIINLPRHSNPSP